ncbi:MAG: hypothetical protein IT237_02860 [Bacteroidia bacterium]|nr:hypothetical protein [Bacteroidia bacterium]
MKKYSFVSLCLMFAISLTAQKLAVDKVDKFTKAVVKRTEWFGFTKTKGTWKPTQSFYRISRIDSVMYFGLELTLNNSVYSIKKGDKIMFLLENDEIVEIENLEYQITNYGDGTHKFNGSANLGTHTEYYLSKSNADKLLSNTIKMVRIYTSEGYKEWEVSPNLNKGIKNLITSVK